MRRIKYLYVFLEVLIVQEIIFLNKIMKHKHTGIIQLCTNLVAFNIIRIRRNVQISEYIYIYRDKHKTQGTETHKKKVRTKNIQKKQHKPHTKDV